MDFNYDTLDRLRRDHPAWRLLRSDHAPLVAGFLYRAFVDRSQRSLPESALEDRLEDELFGLRESLGDDKFPKAAREYLDDWTLPERAWLRKFYRDGSDEPHFDLMPAAGKAISWLASLSDRSFVGTESRGLLVFELLRQIAAGSEADPAGRVEDLKRRRAELDHELELAGRGEIRVLDASAIKDRFQQLSLMSRELLADLREVEHNFRSLDRQFREGVARGAPSKGELLDASLGRRDEITESDQGRSFDSFWDFLLAEGRAEEFSELLDRVLRLPAIREMDPDDRMRRIHHDWMDAGEHTQRTVRKLSRQLRRFLDNRAQLENRRIMDLLQSIESSALVLRDDPPKGKLAAIDGTKASIGLPMERPLHTERREVALRQVELEAGDEDLDVSMLYRQVVIDRQALADHLSRALETRRSVTLGELCDFRPPRQGLAEVLAYMQMAVDSPNASIDEEHEETVSWKGRDRSNQPVLRSARIPRVIFVR